MGIILPDFLENSYSKLILLKNIELIVYLKNNIIYYDYTQCILCRYLSKIQIQFF